MTSILGEWNLLVDEVVPLPQNFEQPFRGYCKNAFPISVTRLALFPPHSSMAHHPANDQNAN